MVVILAHIGFSILMIGGATFLVLIPVIKFSNKKRLAKNRLNKYILILKYPVKIAKLQHINGDIRIDKVKFQCYKFDLNKT